MEQCFSKYHYQNISQKSSQKVDTLTCSVTILPLQNLSRMFLTQAVIRQWECRDDSYRVGDWVVTRLSLIWRVANGWRKRGWGGVDATANDLASRQQSRVYTAIHHAAVMAANHIWFMSAFVVGAVPGKGRKLRSAQWSGALLETFFLFFFFYQIWIWLCEDSVFLSCFWQDG